MLRRTFLPAGCLVLAIAAAIIGQEREQLKNPVFHVPKTSPAAGQPVVRGPAPVLESTPVPNSSVNLPAVPSAHPPQIRPTATPPINKTPLTTPSTMVAGERPVAEVASSIPPLASNKVAVVEQQAIPEISEARQTLNLAIQDARANLVHIKENVRDYSCLFIKQECVKGEILPPEYMELKVRNEQRQNGQVVIPFSIYGKFLRPNEIKNREIIFVQGRHGSDKLRVKEGAGGRRFLPSMLLRTTSPLIMSTNRYPISEIGLINLTQRLIDRSVADPDVDACEITYKSGAKMDGRPCKFLQVKRPTPKVGNAAELGMNVYLAQVLIDEELHVPIRYAAYSWPSVEGSRPEVVEMYTYKNLKLNVGLTDQDFDHKNPAYNF